MSAIIRSIDKLTPELRDIVKLIVGDLKAINSPMQVFETLRSFERQEELVKNGYSKTMNSKHLIGRAVDFVVFVNGDWSWDYKKYEKEYNDYGNIAIKYGLVWGGNWLTFKDYPHAQLPDTPIITLKTISEPVNLMPVTETI